MATVLKNMIEFFLCAYDTIIIGIATISHAAVAIEIKYIDLNKLQTE